MNERETIDQADEEILTSTPSDEQLEAVALRGGGGKISWTNYMMNSMCMSSACC